MSIQRMRLQRLIGQLLDTVNPDNSLVAILGTYDTNGTEMVNVPDRNGYVYARIGGSFSEVIEAFNERVFPVFNLKVRLIQDPTNPNTYYVDGRDIEQYRDWGSDPYLPKHGNQHSFGYAIISG